MIKPIRRTQLIAAAAALWLVSNTPRASAQGSGSIAAPPSVNGIDGSPFRVTRTITGVLKAAPDNGNLLIDRDNGKGTLQLKLADRARIAGERKQKLTASDLSAGQKLRVIYDPGENLALDIRILGERK